MSLPLIGSEPAVGLRQLIPESFLQLVELNRKLTKAEVLLKVSRHGCCQSDHSMKCTQPTLTTAVLVLTSSPNAVGRVWIFSTEQGFMPSTKQVAYFDPISVIDVTVNDVLLRAPIASLDLTDIYN